MVIGATDPNFFALHACILFCPPYTIRLTLGLAAVNRAAKGQKCPRLEYLAESVFSSCATYRHIAVKTYRALYGVLLQSITHILSSYLLEFWDALVYSTYIVIVTYILLHALVSLLGYCFAVVVNTVFCSRAVPRLRQAGKVHMREKKRTSGHQE